MKLFRLVPVMVFALSGVVISASPAGADTPGYQSQNQGPIAPALGSGTFGSVIRSITKYPVPGNDPWGTAFDSYGRVWVAMPGCDPSPTCPGSPTPGKLGLFDPRSNTWTVVSLPSGYGQPLFIAVAPTGKVWFTMPVTNSIGVYDPASSTVAQWVVPTAGAGPWDLAIDFVGRIWFTEHYVNQIGSFDPISKAFHEIATPAPNSNPYGIIIDRANDVWFTENNDAVALIGEFTNHGVLNEFRIRNSSTTGTGLTPHLITIDPRGNIWWSEGWVHAIGTLNLRKAQPGTNDGVTEYFYTSPCGGGLGGCSHTSGISADKSGLIWLDDSLQNTFASFPIGGGSFSFFASPGSHPHDGLNVDSQNRIWFGDEFSNDLAEAIPFGCARTPTWGNLPSCQEQGRQWPPKWMQNDPSEGHYQHP